MSGWSPTRRCSAASGALLRHGPRGDTWRGSSPSREEIESALGDDEELISVVFEDSIADTLDRYIADDGLKHALFGQGVIGAYAGPRDPGTAPVKLMHHQGDLLGKGAVLGLRGGRHGPRLVRDRAGGAGGRRDDRRRRARCPDRAGEGVELGERRADPAPGR